MNAIIANARATIYAPWRIVVIHMLARALGVLVKVEGMPFGCSKLHLAKWRPGGNISGLTAKAGE